MRPRCAYLLQSCEKSSLGTSPICSPYLGFLFKTMAWAMRFAASVVLLLLSRNDRMVMGASYRPGIAPRTYQEGEQVPVRVDAVTSTRTQIPMDYYHLPFCQPEGGPLRESQDLGQFLEGSRLQSTPFEVFMKTETYCAKVSVFPSLYLYRSICD